MTSPLALPVSEATVTVGTRWFDTPDFMITSEAEIDAADIDARIEWRTKPDGALVVSAATTGGGTADGEITITALGGEANQWEYEAEVVLPAAVTATLEPYSNGVGAIEQAGYGLLVAWTATVGDGDPFPVRRYELRVEAQTTTEVP